MAEAAQSIQFMRNDMTQSTSDQEKTARFMSQVTAIAGLCLGLTGAFLGWRAMADGSTLSYWGSVVCWVLSGAMHFAGGSIHTEIKMNTEDRKDWHG